MRQKRAKAYKRVMALYVGTFGFRTPYQVLLSDAFLLEAAKQKDIDTLGLVTRLLGADTKYMITQCCVEALYKLGKEYQGVVDVAKRAERRKCNHREALAPTDCIKDVVGESRSARGRAVGPCPCPSVPSIPRGLSAPPPFFPQAITSLALDLRADFAPGESNKHRYVLCLSSAKFQAQMAAVPGLPIVHFNATGVLVLSPPSQATVRAKLAQEDERRRAGAALLDGVVDGENVKGAPGSASAAVAEAETRSRKQGPKAPNPLSMRKKKRKADGGEGGGKGREEVEGEGEGDGEDPGRKKKRRKRGRGKGAVAEAIDDLRSEHADKIRAMQAAQQHSGSDSDSD